MAALRLNCSPCSEIGFVLCPYLVVELMHLLIMDCYKMCVSFSVVENMGFVLIWIDDFGCLSYVVDA
jgi:hypothetical protein